MRAMVILGVVIAGLGLATLLGLLNFSEKKEVLKIGDLEVSATEERTVPQWVSILAIVAGAGIAVAGLSRKR